MIYTADRKLSPAEKIALWKQKKKNKKKDQKLKWWHHNSDETNKKRRKERQSSTSLGAIKKRVKRENDEIRRVNRNSYMRQCKSKKKIITPDPAVKESSLKGAFTNRSGKSRALNKLRRALPATPIKKVAVLSTYLKSLKNHSSPTVLSLQKLNIINNAEEQNNLKLANALIGDIKEMVSNTKQKRSDSARTAMNVLSASVSGTEISKSKSKIQLAKKLSISPKRISGGKRLRAQISHSESSSFKFTTRKTRNDAIADDLRKDAYQFWLLPGNSHPTGNKSDVKRVRLGPKLYSSHQLHILEQTQTEIYQEFKRKNPHIKMSQRVFERCKPYFVMPARPKDRQTCCCRYHVEVRSVFKTCMDFRCRLHKKLSLSETEKYHYPIYEHLSDVVKATLCTPDEHGMFQRKCLNRQCEDCGVEKLLLMEEEKSNESSAPDVEWEKYEYKIIENKGKETRKLVLIKKKTKPHEMFSYFKSILGTFPAHQYRANWQNAQLKALIENLPVNDCIAIHDFSENYGCSEKEEIQSTFFKRIEVSIHVSVLHRHAVLEVDGFESLPSDSRIVTEYFYVISPDTKHDNHFTYYVQQQIAEYLKSISYNVNIMHEFTDGCQTQYKSRHCMGDLSRIKETLGYKGLVRNYFETAHAKGPQDAAGGLLKRQADLAVVKGKAIIQSAQDLFTYAEHNLRYSKASGLNSRIFRYVQTIPRNECNPYQPIPNNRAIHQVRSTNSANQIFVRELSCYICNSCSEDCNYNKCSNTDKLGEYKKIEVKLESKQQQTVFDNDIEENIHLKDLLHKDTVVAVVTDEQDEDYYLIKVTSPPEVLSKNATDKWNMSYPAGMHVFRGYYYDRVGVSLKFKLIPNKQAIVPLAAVVYICSDVTATKSVEIPENLHLDIIDAVDECSI